MATTGALTGDVAGSAAPPILTWRRHVIHHGAAGKNRETRWQGIDLNACDCNPTTLLKQQQKQPARKLRTTMALLTGLKPARYIVRDGSQEIVVRTPKETARLLCAASLTGLKSTQ